MQTPSDKELYDWLYAMNPLLAGQIRLFFISFCRNEYSIIQYSIFHYFYFCTYLVLGLVWLAASRMHLVKLSPVCRS